MLTIDRFTRLFVLLIGMLYVTAETERFYEHLYSRLDLTTVIQPTESRPNVCGGERQRLGLDVPYR